MGLKFQSKLTFMGFHGKLGKKNFGLKPHFSAVYWTDLLSFSWIMVFALIYRINLHALPAEKDVLDFHLASAYIFESFGGISLWDYYHFAPGGRPHLYPPILPLFVWIIRIITGLDYIGVARLIVYFNLIFTLLFTWLFVRMEFGRFEALFSLLLATSNSWFVACQVSLSPASIIAGFLPLFMLLYCRGRKFLASILLSIFLYLHLGMSYLVFGCLLLSLLFLYPLYKRNFMVGLTVAFLSMVAYLPWFVHVLLHLDWIHSLAFKSMTVGRIISSMNFLSLLFIPLGVLVCLFMGRRKPSYLILLAYWLGYFLLFLAPYGHRFYWHSPLTNSMLAGVAMGQTASLILSKVRYAKIGWSLTLILIALTLFSAALCEPHLFRGKIVCEPTAIRGGFELAYLTLTSSSPPQVYRTYNDPEFMRILDWIKFNTRKDVIVYGEASSKIVYETGRRVQFGGFLEVAPEKIPITSREEIFRFIMEDIVESRANGIMVVRADNIPIVAESSDKVSTELLFRHGEWRVLHFWSKLDSYNCMEIDGLLFWVEYPPYDIIFVEELIEVLDLQHFVIGICQGHLTSEDISLLLGCISDEISSLGVCIRVNNPENIHEDFMEFLKVNSSLDALNHVSLFIEHENVSDEVLSLAEEIDKLGFTSEISIRLSYHWRNLDLKWIDRVDYVALHIPPLVEVITETLMEKIEDAPRDKISIYLDTHLGSIGIHEEELRLLLHHLAGITFGKLYLIANRRVYDCILSYFGLLDGFGYRIAGDSKLSANVRENWMVEVIGCIDLQPY